MYIRYHLDGSLFDLRRLQQRPKLLLREALIADDCALMAHNVQHLQVIADEFSEAAKEE